MGYHAGMEEEARARAQDRWRAGEVPVVVATVAFGMGIDRPDVRYVVHAAMPQSVEHYQQEVGRAGRGGGRAEGILFWSPEDYGVWEGLMRAQASGGREEKLRLLLEMCRFCSVGGCRHRGLVEYFGQAWKGGPCGACDVCTPGPEARAAAGPISRSPAPSIDRRLYERLRDVRRRIADARNVPAFRVLSESALRELARRRPATLEEFMGVAGIGPREARAIGARLIEAIRAHPS